MCLITNQLKSKIASKDITCYKILLLTSDNFYISPYRHFTFFENQVNPKKVFKAKKSWWTINIHGDDLEVINDNGIDAFTLNSGVFHMYKDYDSAVKAIKWLVPREKESYAIFECVIPKGPRYYEGFTSIYRLPSIASDKLKFIKQL
ncbi:MAG: hypothetical protein SPF22_04080 [Candidatus Onthovivens sp.]|nr:hypothetical protein [Candidatus Onthovivens sp.]